MKIKHPNFTGKFVSLSVTGDDYSLTMDCPRFELQGGRWFLIGIVPKGVSNGDWSEGALRAVAWDQVNYYLIFDSLNDYLKGLKKFNKYKRKN
jgi:hypothetical protein